MKHLHMCVCVLTSCVILERLTFCASILLTALSHFSESLYALDLINFWV